MSAVLTRRRTKGRAREGYRQPSLFGQVVAPPPLPQREERAAEAIEPTEAAVFDVPTTDIDIDIDAPAVGTAAVLGEPTLDEAISGLWRGLLSGEQGECPVCGSAMEPRYAAGAAVVGGRCGGCSVTLA
jgi:hypothetical protein